MRNKIQNSTIIQVDFVVCYGEYDNVFAGLTSAFVVSKSRADWLKDFQLPTAFLQYCCNNRLAVTFYLAKKQFKKTIKQTTLFLSTLVLGILFVVCNLYLDK
jgi:hypothetical protein